MVRPAVRSEALAVVRLSDPAEQRNFVVRQRPRPQSGRLQFAVEMPDNFAGGRFRANEQRSLILQQNSAPRLAGHAPTIAEKFQRPAIVSADQVLPGGGFDLGYRETDQRKAPVGSDFKSDVTTRSLGQIRAKKIEMDLFVTAAFGE